MPDADGTYPQHKSNGDDHVDVISQSADQKALQSVLDLMLDEHCCSIGPVGLHSLLLFGSEILTCEIATERASTKPHSSVSSGLQLRLGGDGSLEPPLAESEHILLPYCSRPSAAATCTEEAATWVFSFDLKDKDFNVRSV